LSACKTPRGKLDLKGIAVARAVTEEEIRKYRIFILLGRKRKKYQNILKNFDVVLEKTT